MKRIVPFLLALGTLLLVAGCGSSPKPQAEVAKPKELPSWYMNPPSNNSIYLYGLGDGKNQEEAVKNALSNLASRLSVTVESQYEVDTTIKQGSSNSFAQTSKRNLKSDVAKIRISNYEIEKTEQMKYNHYIVLVRSDKEKFYNGLLKELDVKLSRAEEQKKLHATSNILKQYTFLKETMEGMKESMTAILVLNTLNEAFDDKAYLGRIEAMNREFDSVSKRINFVVKGDSASSGMIEPIRVALTDSGLKVAPSTNNDSLIVQISTRSEQTSGMGFIIARMVVNIEVKTAQGKTVGGNKLMINGHSPQSYSQAQENGAKKLGSMIAKDGITTILGITL